MNHPKYEHPNNSVAAFNTRASAALCEMALAIPRCRPDQSSRSFLPALRRLWNLLPSGVISGGILRSFKSGKNLCPLRAWLEIFFIFISVSFCCSIACLVLWVWGRSGL